MKRSDSIGEVWVNPNRINISTRNTGQENNNFPEFVSRMTGIPQREIIFRFDNRETIPEPEASVGESL